MRERILNRKIEVSIVVVMLFVCLYQSPSYGQLQNNVPDFTPVSDRTPQVRDTIVALVPGVNSANDVTAAHLALIINLNLSNQNITTLKTGDFDGMSSLTSLALYKNKLKRLPEGLFSDLSSLEKLDLGSNALSSLPEGLFSDLSSLRWLSLSFIVKPLNKLTGSEIYAILSSYELFIRFTQMRA